MRTLGSSPGIATACFYLGYTSRVLGLYDAAEEALRRQAKRLEALGVPFRVVEAAGGVLRDGSERVLVRRTGGETEVDLRAVRDGKAEDVPLAPGDEVVVRARRR